MLKHLKLPYIKCSRNHRGKHCFHTKEGRNPDYKQQTIVMECCHCNHTVIAYPTVFTETKRT